MQSFEWPNACFTVTKGHYQWLYSTVTLHSSTHYYCTIYKPSNKGIQIATTSQSNLFNLAVVKYLTQIDCFIRLLFILLNMHSNRTVLNL